MSLSYKLRRPRRPAVPMATHALLATLLIERGILREGHTWAAGVVGKAILAAEVVLLVLACAGMLAKRYAALPLVMLLACVLPVATAATSWHLERLWAATKALEATPVSQHAMQIVSDPTERDAGYRYRASVALPGAGQALVWLSMAECLPRGTTVQGVGQFTPNADDDWGISARMQGICGSVRLRCLQRTEPPNGVDAVVTQVRDRVCGYLQADTGEGRALLASCVCARKDALARFGLDDLFSKCGVAHLVAVSGGHLAILMLLVTTLFQALRIRPALRTAMCLLTCTGFVVCCGMPVSAVRALVMVGCANIAALMGRRSHSLSSVSIVGLCMALYDPMLSGQVSFLLSVCSVGGLCLFSAYGSYLLHTIVGDASPPRLLPYRLRRRFSRARSSLCDSLGASLAALFATVPITADTFGEISLVGPLANLLIALPFSLFVELGMLAVFCSALPLLPNLLLCCCDRMAQVILFVLRLIAALPNTALAVGAESGPVALAWAAAIVALLVFWPRLRRAWLLAGLAGVAAVAFATFVAGRYFAPARICILDIGQGDAILVQDGASAVLVDTGPDAALVEALARQHVYHLDAVVITHLHADHYGALDELVGRVACDKVVVAAGVGAHLNTEIADAVQALGAHPVHELSYGDTLQAGGFSLRMVWPTVPVDGSENAHSIELVAEYEQGGARLLALLTGDAERDETGAVVTHGDVGDIDLLKVGHHGSEISVTQALAATLGPEVSVASAGEGNSYGHPRAECVDALERAGSWFLCTKDVGDVDVRPGPGGPVVLTQR